MSGGSDSAQSERSPWRLLRLLRTGKVLGVTAVLGLAAAGISYASIPDSGGVIHGCYNNKSYALRVIDTAKTSTCPSGTTSLNWNQTGPQGPAGVATGVFGSSSTSAALTDGVGALLLVLSSSQAPAAGTYYVDASLTVYIGQGDGVNCTLEVDGAFVGPKAEVDPVANSGFVTLPLTAAVSLSTGQSVQVFCGDYTGASDTGFTDGGITGTLINNSTGSAATANSVATTHHAG